MSFEMLYVLRLKGLASIQALAEATGTDASAAAQIAFALERDGLVDRRAGHLAGWSLTPAGRDLVSRLLAEEQSALLRRSEIEACFQAFLLLDEPFKEICTAWQLPDRTTLRSNDHSDRDYDAAVIARLNPLHARASAIACDLADVLPRFRSYEPRLARAYDRLIGGDERWLTSPMIGSYHDVWMELHEDLLMTLGRTR